MTDLPIACTLTPTELQSRGAQLLSGLVARTIGRVPVTNGLRWDFAPTEGLLAELAQVIDAERRCCRFLRFAVAAETNCCPPDTAVGFGLLAVVPFPSWPDPLLPQQYAAPALFSPQV